MALPMAKPDSLLREAREARRLNQDDIALLLDTTQPTISNWESGDNAPHASMWPEIARVYGVEMADLAEFFSKVRPKPRGRAAS